jgi:hypothetical protein
MVGEDSESLYRQTDPYQVAFNHLAALLVMGIRSDSPLESPKDP